MQLKDRLLNGGDWNIPVKTLWKKGDPITIDEIPANTRGGLLELKFGGLKYDIFLQNKIPEGKTEIELNEVLEFDGYEFLARRMVYNADGSYSYFVEIIAPATSNPIPLVAIGIVVGVVALGFVVYFTAECLTEVKAILKLPVFPIVAGTALLVIAPVALKAFKN